MIYENPIRLQVINSQAAGNGPRVLLVFAKVNMLKNDDRDIRSFMRRAKVIPRGGGSASGGPRERAETSRSNCAEDARP